MLRDIQTYIADRGMVSLSDLSLHFHADSEALQPMLSKLIRKGRIRKVPMPEQCSGCTCCTQESLELYEWVQ
jgi:hypothetical protein